jgi:hypothetical protein
MVLRLVETPCQLQNAISVKFGKKKSIYNELGKGKGIIMSLRFKLFSDISEDCSASIFMVEV